MSQNRKRLKHSTNFESDENVRNSNVIEFKFELRHIPTHNVQAVHHCSQVFTWDEAAPPNVTEMWTAVDARTGYRYLQSAAGGNLSMPRTADEAASNVRKLRLDWSGKSPLRHNSAADGPTGTKFGRPTRNHMPMTLKTSKWKPKVGIRYSGCLFLETGSNNILAIDWDILSKLGLQIYFDLLKCATSPNLKPEVDMRRCSRCLEKSI